MKSFVLLLLAFVLLLAGCDRAPMIPVTVDSSSSYFNPNEDAGFVDGFVESFKAAVASKGYELTAPQEDRIRHYVKSVIWPETRDAIMALPRPVAQEALAGAAAKVATKLEHQQAIVALLRNSELQAAVAAGVASATLFLAIRRMPRRSLS